MENDAVKQIPADLDRGIVPAPDVISYEFKGVMKYAAFVVLTNQSILVMTADENDVLHGVSEMTRYMIIGGGLLIFISMVLILLTIGYMLRRWMTLRKSYGPRANLSNHRVRQR